jgi:hypothetical protein
MATINDVQIIRTLLENNGHYPQDPQVVGICLYANPFGLCAAISYAEADYGRYRVMPEFIELWNRKDGLTKPGAGILLLMQRGKITNLPITDARVFK